MDNLQRAVKTALKICTKESSRFQLNCVCFQPTSAGVIVTATDGKRLFLSNPFSLSIRDRKLIHRDDALGLANPIGATGVVGDYPALLNLLPGTFKATATIPGKELSRLRKALDKIAKDIRAENRVRAKKREELEAQIRAYNGPFKGKTALWEKEAQVKDLPPMVILTVDVPGLTLEPPAGEATKLIFAVNSKESFRIGINPDFLLDALTGVRGDVEIGFNDKDKPLAVTHEHGRHVIMPIRLKD